MLDYKFLMPKLASPNSRDASFAIVSFSGACDAYASPFFSSVF
jgi:hypothetical protein